jgi:hypothetical protein
MAPLTKYIVQLIVFKKKSNDISTQMWKAACLLCWPGPLTARLLIADLKANSFHVAFESEFDF